MPNQSAARQNNCSIATTSKQCGEDISSKICSIYIRSISICTCKSVSILIVLISISVSKSMSILVSVTISTSTTESTSRSIYLSTHLSICLCLSQHVAECSFTAMAFTEDRFVSTTLSGSFSLEEVSSEARESFADFVISRHPEERRAPINGASKRASQGHSGGS